MRKMRACFLGPNICALGFGVATLQAPRLVMDPQTGNPEPANHNEAGENRAPLEAFDDPQTDDGPV
jgi:hypothetical protein